MSLKTESRFLLLDGSSGIEGAQEHQWMGPISQEPTTVLTLPSPDTSHHGKDSDWRARAEAEGVLLSGPLLWSSGSRESTFGLSHLHFRAVPGISWAVSCWLERVQNSQELPKGSQCLGTAKAATDI